MKIPGEYMPEYRKLNRRLIPANIILFVLALVACWAQIFMPLITVDVELPEGSLTEIVTTFANAMSGEEDGEDAGGSPDEAEDAQGGNEDAQGEKAQADGELTILDKAELYFDYVPEFDFTLKFSPLTLVTSPKDDMDAVIDWLASLLPTGDEIKAQAENFFSSLVAGVVNTEIILSLNMNRINDKLIKIHQKTQEDIVSIFSDLMADNASSAKDAFSAYIKKVTRYVLFGVSRSGYSGSDLDSDLSAEDFDRLLEELDTADLGEEAEAEIEATAEEYMDVFDRIVEAGTSEGEDGSSIFSVYDVMNGYLDYEQQTYGLTDSLSALTEIMKFMDDPGAYASTAIRGIIEETGIDDFIESAGMSYDAAMIILFIIFSAFPAALWAILAIAAFVHLFTGNKKVAMWYTKLVCIWPCILFFILPCVLLATLPAAMGVEAAFSVMTVRIASSGLVTGICYLLMWAVSIFLCFPAKRKLRWLKKQIKAEA